MHDLLVLQHQDYGIVSQITLNRVAHLTFLKTNLKTFLFKATYFSQLLSINIYI